MKAYELNKVYDTYKSKTNMTCSELKKWKSNPCSKKASLSEAPLNRNIRLMCKSKSKWTGRDVKDAKRTINFIDRMSAVKAGKEVKGCNISKKTISLKNWAKDPNKA